MNEHIIWDISPEIFTIGSLSIRYYSLLFGTGIMASFFLLSYYFKKENKNMELLEQIFMYIFFGIIIGARVGHCLFYEADYYLSHPLEIILPWRGSIFGDDFRFTGFQGLASHGGALGILIAIIIISKKNKVPIYWILDKVALVIPLSAASIRIGNFFNSEILGKATDSSLGIVFVRVDNIPRHPAQLYEALAYIIILLIVNFYYKYIQKVNTEKKVIGDGHIFGIMLSLVFIARIIIEYFKENQEAFEQGMILNMGQLLSIPFVLAGVYIAVRKWRV